MGLTIDDIREHLYQMPVEDILDLLGVGQSELLDLLEPNIIEQRGWLSEHFGDYPYDN